MAKKRFVRVPIYIRYAKYKGKRWIAEEVTSSAKIKELAKPSKPTFRYVPTDSHYLLVGYWDMIRPGVHKYYKLHLILHPLEEKVPCRLREQLARTSQLERIMRIIPEIRRVKERLKEYRRLRRRKGLSNPVKPKYVVYAKKRALPYARVKYFENLPVVRVYKKCLGIIGEKGEDSKYAGKRFIHRFKSTPAIYGLSDGSLLITHRKIRGG